jgi:single-stranded-DNA-specific exonuclease
VQHGVKLRGVAFGGGDWCVELGATAGPISLAFRPVINSFNGRRTVELHVADWRCDEAARATVATTPEAVAGM